jgi:DNA-binding NarL/FixJ family response regulator
MSAAAREPVSRPIRVVVADDEPDVCLLLELQLRNAGLEVVATAADGAEALAACRSLRPDAVVMDLLMPGVNGFEAIATLQAEMPEVGIVAYTAVAGEFVRSEMARLNVPLVLKSGDPTNLVRAIEEVVAAGGSAGKRG